MNQLKKYRKQIDEINNKIIKILKQRQTIDKKIKDYKKKNKLKVVDKKREEQVLEKLEKDSIKYNLDKKYIKEIFKKITENSKRIQNGS